MMNNNNNNNNTCVSDEREKTCLYQVSKEHRNRQCDYFKDLNSVFNKSSEYSNTIIIYLLQELMR